MRSERGLGMRWTFALLIAAASVGVFSARAVHADDPPLFDFEAGTEEWVCPQAGSSVVVTREAELVKSGQGALEWSYNGAGDDSTLQRPGPMLKAGANCVSFWIRASESTNIQLQLFEGNSGSYMLMMHLPARQWRRYEVALTDLVGGPAPDPNGQLDLEQVAFIQLFDTSRFSTPGGVGNRKLWLDGLTFTNGNVPQRRYTGQEGDRQQVYLDDFSGGSQGWESSLTAETEMRAEGERRYLHAKYTTGFSLTDHLDARYGAAETILITARANRAARLRVELREWDGTFNGPRYQAEVALPAGKEWQTVKIPIKEFKLLAESKDPNSRLDMPTVWLFDLQDAAPADPNLVGELDIDSIAAQLAP
jgi:hypothetical protein